MRAHRKEPPTRGTRLYAVTGEVVLLADRKRHAGRDLEILQKTLIGRDDVHLQRVLRMQLDLERRDVDFVVEGVVRLRIDEEVGADAEVDRADQRVAARTYGVGDPRVVLTEAGPPREADRRVVIGLHFAKFNLGVERIVGVLELETDREILSRRVDAGRLDEKAVAHQIL